MTSTFEPDTEETPVIFRMERAPKKHGADVVAVFPCIPADYAGAQMTCFAHMGQHSGCDYGWYVRTRAARPEEYADLKRELEAAPYGYRLKVYQRITREHRDTLASTARRLRKRVHPAG